MLEKDIMSTDLVLISHSNSSAHKLNIETTLISNITHYVFFKIIIIIIIIAINKKMFKYSYYYTCPQQLLHTKPLA